MTPKMYYLMRTILRLVCLFMLAVSFANAQKLSNIQLYQVTVRNKAGFIDQTGKIVVQPKFDGDRYMLSDFSEGLAEFKDMKALPTYPFSKEGYMDKAGRIVIKPQFDVAYDFSNGRAQVVIGDLASFIDKTGNQVIRLGPYQAARSLKEGLAAVHSNFEFWYINTDGKIIISRRPGLPKDFSEGFACVYLPVGDKLKGGYIDKSGQIMIQPQFDECFDFSEGLASVKIHGKYGYVDKYGKMVIPATYKSAYNFVNGRARVSSEEKDGFIDKFGKPVIAEKFDTGTWDFSEGLAPACQNGLCGYIDTNGRYVIEPKFNSAFGFKDGIASVLQTNYRSA